MNTSSQTLRVQGAPIRLLMQLLTDRPDLPAVTYHIDSIIPSLLDIAVHRGQFAEFEAWRQALGLAVPEERSYGGDTWVAVSGLVQDVQVTLTGHGKTAEVAAYVAEHVAVAA
ncbi:hypothetical protein ACFV07_07790 [Streptomyces anulatus]|uniref:hypothetical protein n=1 Tax=Streptomyces anulatus TaxID=1892 RepID=UPI00369CD8A5